MQAVNKNDLIRGSEEAMAVADRAADQILMGLPIGGLSREVRRLLNEAAQNGYAQGFEEGEAKSRRDMAPKLDGAISEIYRCAEVTCGRMQAENDTRCEALGGGQMQLALALAARIIYSELRHDDGAFLSLYRVAASHVDGAESVVLKVGPAIYEVAQRHAEELRGCIRGVKEFEIKRVGENDGLCVIETPYGSVDASIDTQLGRAAQALGADCTRAEAVEDSD